MTRAAELLDRVRDFADVNPAAAYTLAEYRRLFRVSARTAFRRIRAGELAVLPGGRGVRRRVLGAEILRLAGLAVGQLPRPQETEAERLARARAAVAAGDRAAARVKREGR